MAKNKWTKELLEDLHHIQELSLDEIAERYGVKVSGIRSLMKYYGVSIRYMKNQWSKELLYDLYHVQELSPAEIARRYSCTSVTVQSQLTYYGIPFRSREQAAQLRDGSNDRYNPTFLDDWSPGLAWFLGLMFTDGTINRELSGAELISKDETLLIKVAALLGDGVTVRPVGNVLRVGIYRKDLVRKLTGYGLEPNKTFKLCFPEVPDEFLSHFCRGLWDGDGWISRKNGYGSRNYLTAGFGCASMPFLESLTAVLSERVSLPIPHFSQHKPKHFWHFAFHGGKAEMLCKWLYHQSLPTVRLERKYDAFKSEPPK